MTFMCIIIETTAKDTSASATSTNEPQPAIKVGDFVFFKMKKYEHEIPQIGKVIAYDGSKITVEWWTGTYSTTWTECRHKGTVLTEELDEEVVLHQSP